MEKYISLTVQPLWENYIFDSEISEGAFGLVYKVRNTQDQKFYAMKIQNLKQLINKSPNNQSNEIIRIFREVNTFKLNHQNITGFHESYFTDDNKFVIITELAETDLRTFRESNSGFSNKQITDIMLQILKGVNYLHNQNIMHRYLSPDNILVFENGTKFKICDFGLASHNAESFIYVGKKYFKAPEISNEEEYSYNNQVDIWSAGIILYYLCTEYYDIEGKRLSDIKKKDPAYDFRLPENRKIFEPLLNKMLSLNSSQRPQALELIADLCLLINEPFNKHIDEEEKSIEAIIIPQNLATFNITLKSKTEKVNEVLAQIGHFNFPAVQNIHPNPNRIFVDYIKVNHDEYQGEIDSVTKKFDGRGRKISIIGNLYEGVWKDNKLNEYGRYILNSGSYFVGEYKDGQQSGYGKYHQDDGCSYEGQYLNGFKGGLGLFKWSDGDQYYGQWVDNKRQGLGVFTTKNGNIDFGQWFLSKRHGIVINIPKDGGKIKINKYENGKLKETELQTDNIQIN
ncbi:protein kinase domain containing protein [Stylonychia lemnae]|uniref:Protein kinase domain containing protein n=1 Tax=Stylonychia lemnae TaxID=5949 RepID=A0A078AE22_STYLE|nr:protein kinase domain containing protein [Stylonychia lemnae]|eukprot:CDW80489.1 protein kinase domain containing protein [Stylonychia lemnae]